MKHGIQLLTAITAVLMVLFLPASVLAQQKTITRKPKVEKKSTPKKPKSKPQNKRVQQGNRRPAPEEERQRVLDNLINNMVYVSGGTFTMGATAEQGSDAWDDEKPAHQVTLSSFYIGKYEVTQREWQAVMGSNPSTFKGNDLPVESVNWDDCQQFIAKLNSLTGKHFRLPTEAEWEYAARGGNKSRGYKYSGSNNIDNVAWYKDNNGDQTHNVGTKSPNELGLYDMAGNVQEWCQDWRGSYSSSAQTNPKGPSSSSKRVIRGGCWFFDARANRVSYRNSRNPLIEYYNIGLRLAL